MKSNKPRYLTKSRFKLARECPAKLFYTGKSDYANQSLEDSFLMSLAEGGFQVGELAKYYFSQGTNIPVQDIKSLDYDEALKQTEQMLTHDEVILFEPAFLYQNLFIRVDILVKKGKQIAFYEVKAKSIDPVNDSFYGKKGDITSSWRPYLEDVAFQKHVLINALPEYNITSHLMLADKSSKCPVDGLHQKFQIVTDEDGRKSVKQVEPITDEDLQEPILCKINTDLAVSDILQDSYGCLRFDQFVKLLAIYYEQDVKVERAVTTACGKCEFYAKSDQSLKDGKKECWRKQLAWKEKDFESQTIFDIWNFRSKAKLISQGVIKLDQLTAEDFNCAEGDSPTSSKQRQWLQVQKYQDKDNTAWFDEAGLKDEMQSWVYPLHFIDFETTATAIPFYKGRRPYEGIAFQFSHHIMYEDGKVEHAGQYLNQKVGHFPNLDFIRALKHQLNQDNGSIFRYASHENSYLNAIHEQLTCLGDEHFAFEKEKDELIGFIKNISTSKKNSIQKWQGERCMIDLLELVKKYYYHPEMKGSNSIKQVLPALLNSSKFVQEKYSKPIYGTETGIPSHNFSNWQWVQYDNNGKVIDPYKLLPKLFEDESSDDLISNLDELKDGGAALTAYAKLQYEQMTDHERQAIEHALLKYCELDTLAMVMLVEGWFTLR